ncbi:MAG: hypothetical protein PVJ78_04870 [Gammaproteobacteria bacterium]|jgi:hypothetical protein
MKPSLNVSDDGIETYRRDGVVCLRKPISAEWIEVLREGLEADLAGPGPNAETHATDRDPGRFFNDFDLWRHLPVLKQFVFEGRCAGIAARRVGSSKITLRSG